MSRYFGTDGIRDLVNNKLTSEFAYKVGKATYVLGYKTIYVGYDTRESSQTLAFSLIAGLLATGHTVYNLNMVSTPCVAYYSFINKSIGIVVTASHNPFIYNGIKFFDCGLKLDEFKINKLESEIDNNIIQMDFGKHYILENNQYLDFIDCLKTKKANILIDCANGSTSSICKYLDYKTINCNPNGQNINLMCGSTNIENVNFSSKYNLLFSLDGDGDRILVKDKTGFVYNGDYIVALLAKKLKLKKVVLTKTANLGIIKYLNDNNIQVFLSDVGDSNVFNKMVENDILLGGETSGHILYNKDIPFGDGLYICSICNNLLISDDFEQIKKDIHLYPEYNLSIEKISNIQITKINSILNDFEKQENTKYLFRKSGTENLYRLLISSLDTNILDKFFSYIKDIINE